MSRTGIPGCIMLFTKRIPQLHHAHRKRQSALPLALVPRDMLFNMVIIVNCCSRRHVLLMLRVIHSVNVYLSITQIASFLPFTHILLCLWASRAFLCNTQPVWLLRGTCLPTPLALALHRYHQSCGLPSSMLQPRAVSKKLPTSRPPVCAALSHTTTPSVPQYLHVHLHVLR